MGEFQFKSGGYHDLNGSWSSYKYARKREHGAIFQKDTVVSNYYRYMSLMPLKSEDKNYGAIFNTEFSTDGKVVVAACERSTYKIYDPLSQKLVCTNSTAHVDSINCIRFLDANSFLTCSDDKSIALWDLRNLKSRILSLVGHTNWVKSVEYCKSTQQLVTSAFDDTIRVWDLKTSPQCGYLEGKVVLTIPCLTRMKLTPCCTKMIISSISGNLVIIHNLDLSELSTKPAEYWAPCWKIPSADYQERPKQKRIPWTAKNKCEVIDEFPEGVEPSCISSLEVHPHGWCVVIRYSGGDWHQEWTAVYDIQLPDINELNSNSKPKRLLYCIVEPNVARGYIKEPCFSNDGRVIGSPFGNTSRLLTFNKNCDELSKCVKTTTCHLTDFKTLVGHKQPVLTCSFSPTLPLLSSGCRAGKVAFFYPQL